VVQCERRAVSLTTSVVQDSTGIALEVSSVSAQIGNVRTFNCQRVDDLLISGSQ
jgi:hypothetical protein